MVLIWNEARSQWIDLQVPVGNITSPDQRFGSSVAFLSESGDSFVVGGPGPTGSEGLIRVFRQKRGSLRYVQFGTDIVGGPGDSIGSAGTIGGDSSQKSTAVLFGTANGQVRKVVFDTYTESWLEPYPSISGLPGQVSAVGSANISDSIAVGVSNTNQATIYSTHR